MGGRIWDKNEEEHFWRKIVPRSPVAADGKGLQLSWAVLAEEMRSKFGRSRREYTWLMLYEHWYQNARTGHSSPNGRHLVAEYKRQIATCVKPAGVTKPVNKPATKLVNKMVARRTATAGRTRVAKRPVQRPSASCGRSRPQVGESTAPTVPAAAKANIDGGLQGPICAPRPAPTNPGFHNSFVVHGSGVEPQAWIPGPSSEGPDYGSSASVL